MRFVVDANVLLSGIVRDSATRRLILNSHLELFAPQHILTEVEKHVLHDADIQRKTGLGRENLQWIYVQLLKSVRLLPSSSEYEKNLIVAQELAVHPEDAPYLAAALTLECTMWSNDSDMKKQQKVPVVTTRELIRVFQDRLLNGTEEELVIRKIIQVEDTNRQLGKKPETTEDVLKKYPHLKDELGK